MNKEITIKELHEMTDCIDLLINEHIKLKLKLNENGKLFSDEEKDCNCNRSTSYAYAENEKETGKLMVSYHHDLGIWSAEVVLNGTDTSKLFTISKIEKVD